MHLIFITEYQLLQYIYMIIFHKCDKFLCLCDLYFHLSIKLLRQLFISSMQLMTSF